MLRKEAEGPQGEPFGSPHLCGDTLTLSLSTHHRVLSFEQKLGSGPGPLFRRKKQSGQVAFQKDLMTLEGAEAHASNAGTPVGKGREQGSPTTCEDAGIYNFF